ncbi:hypothetical protein LJB97_00860 [Parabacteroides sp. OttesenSCG-928-O15]|nr:hypothetical protein [Parabacteroides sp. OttesenSCG-928-O15]
MKEKVSLSAILLMLLCVASCYHEEGPINQSDNTKFDLILRSSEIQSRAINGQGNYEYADAAELEINKCFVAIFDKQSGKRLSYKEVSVGATNPENQLVVESKTDDAGNPATPTYKISNIEAKSGEVNIVVIANSARTDLASYNTYDELIDGDVFEQTRFTATYDPRNLVKVGDMEYTISSGTNVIVVPLTQLAARVDFNLKVTIEPETIDESYDYFFTTEMLEYLRWSSIIESPLPLGNMFGKEIIGWSCNNDPGVAHDIWYGEGNNRINYKGDENVLAAHLNRAYFDRIERSYAYALAVEKITIENIQTKTWLMLPPLDANYFMSINHYQNDFLLPAWQKQFSTPLLTADMKITFYTYEKDFYGNAPEEGAIKVGVEGTLTRCIKETRVRYKNEEGVYGLWIDDKGNPSADLTNAEKFVILNQDEFVRDEDVAPVEKFNTDEYKLEFPKKYQVYIDPKKEGKNNTYGLIHGNRYDVTAKISKEPELPEEEEEIIVDLEYEVTNWVGKTVDLPVFE